VLPSGLEMVQPTPETVDALKFVRTFVVCLDDGGVSRFGEGGVTIAVGECRMDALDGESGQVGKIAHRPAGRAGHGQEIAGND